MDVNGSLLTKLVKCPEDVERVILFHAGFWALKRCSFALSATHAKLEDNVIVMNVNQGIPNPRTSVWLGANIST